MESYSQNDTIKNGKQALGLIGCMAIGLGMVLGPLYGPKLKNDLNEYKQRQGARIVNQDSGLEEISKCEGGK